MGLDCKRNAFEEHDGCPAWEIPNFPDLKVCQDLDPARIHGLLSSSANKVPIFDNLLPIVDPLPAELPEFECAIDENSTEFSVRYKDVARKSDSNITIKKADDTCMVTSIDVLLDLPKDSTKSTIAVGTGGDLVDIFTDESTGVRTTIGGDAQEGGLYFVFSLTNGNVFAIG